MTIQGECFCGTVKYQIDGKLWDAKSCHCSRCRKAFNAQASASALVNPKEFTWLTGKESLSSYIGKQGYGLQFCSICGSTLCTLNKGEIYQVTLGCINGDPDIEIGMHIFVHSKAPWEIISEGVLQYTEGPDSQLVRIKKLIMPEP